MESARLVVAIAVVIASHFLSEATAHEPAVCDTTEDLLSTECRDNESIKDDANACGIYLAPSTIGGTGLGVFAGKHFKSGELVGYGDVCIPLIDVSWHVNLRNDTSPLEGLSWNGSFMGMSTESSRDDVEAFCAGLIALVNNAIVPNVGRPSLEYDDCGFHRHSSIGAGSFTPYFNVTSAALNNVPAGSELFINYGQKDWFSDVRPSDAIPALPEMDWLRSNGACLDNIRIGLSRIASAGHGAFATRKLPAGTVITVSPLRVIPHRSFFSMYKFVGRKGKDGTKKEWYRLIDEIESTQLLLNYCFGGSALEVILCPYGTGVNLINHDQLRANVHVQWAVDFPAFHNHSFVIQGNKDDLLSAGHPRIAFQYVALKDINEGEELLMDYGDDWVSAWVTHVAHYNVSDDSYIDARAYEELFHDNPLLTFEQMKFDPYPKNLYLRCHPALLTQEIDMNATYVWTHADFGSPCQILDYFREFDRELYTIETEIDVLASSENAKEGFRKQRIVMTDVPRSAIRFYDRPYSTDIHQTHAFRHAIGLSRSMIAWQWMT